MKTSISLKTLSDHPEWLKVLGQKLNVTDWDRIWDEMNRIAPLDLEEDSEEESEIDNRPLLEIDWTEEEKRVYGRLTE